MKISAVGLLEIERSEGWSSGPYLDRVASPPVWTAYFGETKGIGPNSPRLTVAQGRRKLRSRFDRDYAPALQPFVGKRGFTQNMYDALGSFIWNCGTGAVGPSSGVGRLLRQGRWRAAANAMLAWVRNGAGRVVPGLVSRRKRERAMFLKAARVDPLAGYTASEKRRIREYDRLVREGRDRARRVVLRSVMTEQRKRIWRAAQGAGGWDAAHRRARYRSLLVRTR